MIGRRDVRAVEIDGDDAAWLRGRTLPDGVELAEVDEIEHFGRLFDRTPGSLLYLPTDVDVVERVVSRALADAPAAPAAPIGVDLFAGCGGFSLGMHKGGFDVVAAVEWDAPAAATYLMNLGRADCRVHFASDGDRARYEKFMRGARAKQRKNKTCDANAAPPIDFDGAWMGAAYREASGMDGGCRAFMFGDISKVTGRQIMDAAAVDAVDVVFGGPPCQGLSTANSKACLEDPRNGMIWEYLRIVAEIKPKTFIIENVPAILTVAKGALFNAIAQLANEAGYDVVATKLDACKFGVPQHRVRAIIVGTLGGTSFRFPMPTHWAIGRPLDDNGWSMAGDRSDRYQKRLPAQAHFDHEARTWSFHEPGEPSAGAAREQAAINETQLDWTVADG